MFHARVLAQMVRNQKEIEQLREIHLLQLKHITRYCDREIEIIDETESMLADHTAREQKQEAHFQSVQELEEARIQAQLATVRVQVEQHHVHEIAKQARQLHRREARELVARQKRDARSRERNFWQHEEELFNAHLAAVGMQAASGTPEYTAKLQELLPAFVEAAASGSLTDDDEDSNAIDLDDDDLDVEVGEGGEQGLTFEAADMREVERQQAREMAMLDAMRKQHRASMRKLKKQHRKVREAARGEQSKSLQAILEAQSADVERLKEQQAKEMKALEESQAASDKLEEDNKLSNDRLYALLPRFIADKMKAAQTIEPIPYENVTVLIADIVSFTSLSSKSSANQVVNLLNRLYSEMDNTLDRFEDVYKLETIGDAYCIVAGVNNRERSVRANALDVIECALAFIDIVQNLDMSDQVQDHIQIRVGVHTGPAVGGVANPSMPKFSLFGDTISVTGVLEQTSRPMHVHISGATCELVQDEYELDVSESIVVDGPQNSKKKLPAYWVAGRKGPGGAGSGRGARAGSLSYSGSGTDSRKMSALAAAGAGAGADKRVTIQGMPLSRGSQNVQ
ncbi:Nitrogen permease reactivator protein [Cladochytrium tenue]|nr:Nitrogen permease reactivator protein [Cladochytrium tenue]